MTLIQFQNYELKAKRFALSDTKMICLVAKVTVTWADAGEVMI